MAMAPIPTTTSHPPLLRFLPATRPSPFPRSHWHRHRLTIPTSPVSTSNNPAINSPDNNSNGGGGGGGSDYDDGEFEVKPEPYATQPPSYKIEKRQKSSSMDTLPRRPTSIEKPEPPNFQIGWKRTKEIKTERPKGYVVADFLEKLESLMGRGQFGSVELLAKTGAIVAGRAREEAEVLVDGGEVDERMATELYRVLRLLEMDLEMVKAAVREETLKERVEQARARCRQAILVALSL